MNAVPYREWIRNLPTHQLRLNFFIRKFLNLLYLRSKKYCLPLWNQSGNLWRARSIRRATIIVPLLVIVILYWSLETHRGYYASKDGIRAVNVEANCKIYDGQNNDLKKILDTLHTLSQLVPEEEQWLQLLKPIDGGGAIETHEMAEKTRQYRPLFEAWADLHLLNDRQMVSIRDDIIQYLKCQVTSSTEKLEVKSQLLDTIQLYDSFRSRVTNMGQTLFPFTAPYFPDHLSLYAHVQNGGRGIVFTAGNNQVPFLLTLITMIRKLGCNLPIEVMYFGDNDLRLDLRQKIEELPGVVTRNLLYLVHNKGWEFESYNGKPFAMLLSSFRETILLDADAGFLQNPEVLFADPGYLESGALFFYDRLSISAASGNKDWLNLAVPIPMSNKMEQSRTMMEDYSRNHQESGVVVLDKSRHFVPLLLITWLNGPGQKGPPDNPGFYEQFIDGDKETFWIGMELAGDTNYNFHDGAIACTGNLSQVISYTEDDDTRSATKVSEYAYNTSTLGQDSKPRSHYGRVVTVYDRNIKLCSPQMLHLDRSQAPLWFNGWIVDDKHTEFEKQKIWEFDAYMLEKDKSYNPNPWEWAGNKPCLTGQEIISFTDAERRVFQDMVETAIDLGTVYTGN